MLIAGDMHGGRLAQQADRPVPPRLGPAVGGRDLARALRWERTRPARSPASDRLPASVVVPFGRVHTLAKIVCEMTAFLPCSVPILRPRFQKALLALAQEGEVRIVRTLAGVVAWIVGPSVDDAGIGQKPRRGVLPLPVFDDREAHSPVEQVRVGRQRFLALPVRGLKDPGMLAVCVVCTTMHETGDPSRSRPDPDPGLAIPVGLAPGCAPDWLPW